MRVLVVNVEANARDSLCSALYDEGYQVAVADTCDYALYLLRSSNQPVIVVVDYPIKKWWESSDFLEKVAADPSLVASHMYLLMLTTTETVPVQIGRALSSMPIMLVAKPLNLNLLLNAVENASQRLRHG